MLAITTRLLAVRCFQECACFYVLVKPIFLF
jgi:hypothetical protein